LRTIDHEIRKAWQNKQQPKNVSINLDA